MHACCRPPLLPSPPLPSCRVRSLADAEPDVDQKMRLRRLFRSLQGVDEEVGRYNGVLAKFLAAPQEEWEAVLAVYRGDLQKPFFEHMQVGAGVGRAAAGSAWLRWVVAGASRALLGQ